MTKLRFRLAIALAAALSALPLAAQNTGVCYSNVAQSIAQGVLVPIPAAAVYFCPAGQTAGSCRTTASSVTLYPTPVLSGTTVPNPETADAGGNFYFCAPTGHYGLEIVGPQGTFFVPDVTLADNYESGGTIDGNLVITGNLTVSGAIHGNADTASALATVPTQCSGNSWARGIAANGNANCAQLAAANLSNGTTGSGAVVLAASPTLSGTIAGNFSFSGNISFSNVVGASITGTSTALAATPSNCGSSGFSFGIAANGNALCNTNALVQTAENNSGCTTTGSSFDVCSMSVTWPSAFADTNYGFSCIGRGPTDSSNPTSGRAVINGTTSKTASGVTVQFATAGSSPISYTGMDCIAKHN